METGFEIRNHKSQIRNNQITGKIGLTLRGFNFNLSLQ